MLTIGTRSLLFGVHQFAIHPWFVALAWWKLYGFPADLRLWVAFFVHDLGYIGKPNMDGPEGEGHVKLGARIMGFFFGPTWHDFSLYHSRFYARRENAPPSRLCYADKLSISLTPAWLYLLLANLSGEIHEYLAGHGGRYAKYADSRCSTETQSAWLRDLQRLMKQWVADQTRIEV